MKQKILKWFIVSVALFLGHHLNAQVGKSHSIKKPPVNDVRPVELPYTGKQTRENAIILMEEIRHNQHNPAYNLKAAQTALLRSPYVAKGLFEMDPTYPLYILTGDKTKDATEMKRLKLEWIKNNPERYQAILAKQQVKK